MQASVPSKLRRTYYLVKLFIHNVYYRSKIKIHIKLLFPTSVNLALLIKDKILIAPELVQLILE